MNGNTCIPENILGRRAQITNNYADRHIGWANTEQRLASEGNIVRFLPSRRHSEDKIECRLQTTRYVCSSWLLHGRALNAPRSAALARPPHTVLSFNFSELPSGEPPQAAANTITVSTVVCGGGGKKKKRVKIMTWTRWVWFSFGRRYCRPRHSGMLHDTPANSHLLQWSTMVLPLVKEKERKILIALSPRAALLFLIRLTFAVRRKESKGGNI